MLYESHRYDELNIKQEDPTSVVNVTKWQQRGAN